MNAKDFIDTIYLGDRGCKEVCINGWDDKISIKVDKISRIRNTSGDWNYYSKEDINDGLIVFTGIKGIKFSPPGHIPNDRINYLELSETEGEIYTFKFSIDSVGSDASSEEVILEIAASGIHIEDPTRPNLKIID